MSTSDVQTTITVQVQVQTQVQESQNQTQVQESQNQTQDKATNFYLYEHDRSAKLAENVETFVSSPEVLSITHDASKPSTIVVQQSDASLRDPEIIKLTEENKRKALETRLETDTIMKTPEDIIARYKKEHAHRIRGSFYLTHEREACIAAGVPIVQIPDSVIYQLTHLGGQEDSSHLIDTLHHNLSNQSTMDVLLAKLEACNAKVAALQNTQSNELATYTNERSMLQTMLITEQAKALQEMRLNPSRVLSGDEVVSNHHFNTVFYNV